MYHPMPARFSPPTVTAVPSAPQSFPFAYITVTMRESLLSSMPRTALCVGSGGARTTRQHPLRVGVTCRAVSLTHSASGMSPGRWTERGGTPYSSTVTSTWVRLSMGVELSELVFVSAQITSDVDVLSAASTARELRKYAVPPASSENWLPGVVAGQTVNPSSPSTASSVLITVISKLCGVDTSCAFDIA